MAERNALREVLFQHSDSRPCRLLWEALDAADGAAESLDLQDYLEVLRVTDGSLCLVAPEDEGDLYVRWNTTGGCYVAVAFWEPWGVVDARMRPRAGTARLLADRDGFDVAHVAETPLGDDGPAADLSEWL